MLRPSSSSVGGSHSLRLFNPMVFLLFFSLFAFTPFGQSTKIHNFVNLFKFNSQPSSQGVLFIECYHPPSCKNSSHVLHSLRFTPSITDQNLEPYKPLLSRVICGTTGHSNNEGERRCHYYTYVDLSSRSRK